MTTQTAGAILMEGTDSSSVRVHHARLARHEKCLPSARMAFHMTRARRLLLSWSLTAVVLGACSATSADAQPSPSITVTILRPRDTNPIFGETLFVEATVTSTNQLSSVVATIGGHSTPLAFDFRWSATIPTADLPYGAMPLVVTATDTTGATAQADIALFHDNPPTLEYLSPVAHALARPDVRIHARCSSSEGPCHLSVVDLPAVTGTGEIDTVVSLADHEGQRVDLTIVATDGLGQERRASRPVWVESSRRLSLVATLAGPILDLDVARALVVDETVPRRVCWSTASRGQASRSSLKARARSATPC